MKPKIYAYRCSDGVLVWMCCCADEPRSGCGDTPIEAYEMWLNDPLPF